MHLYDLDQRILAVGEYINAYAAEHDGEIPDDLDAVLDALKIERDDKLLNLARWIKALDAESAAITAEARKLAARAAQRESLAERIKSAVARSLGEGVRLESPDTILSWRSSQAVEITDESAIPEQFFHVVRSVSKADIKAEIKSGREVAGAKIVTKNNLQIK
jgi:hypothetical protein